MAAINAKGQGINEELLSRLRVQQTFDLPKDILSTRSIALISVPKGSPKGEWKKWATEMQKFFATVGVDVVAYLSIDELDKNVTSQQELTRDIFSKRGIKNLIILSVLDIENKFLFGVGSYNRKWTFFDEKSSFWLKETDDLDNVWADLETLFKTDTYRRRNLLVLDTPEFFELSISFTSRTERFTKLMESQKIAIPAHVALDDDPNRIVRLKADIINGTEDRSGPATELKNSQLKSIIGQYPFEAEIVNLNEKNEDGWLRSGYGFILYNASGNESELRQKLKYTGKSKGGTLLTKFYLKQLRTGNLYLGREWDAATDQNQALLNFINRVRAEFKVENQ